MAIPVILDTDIGTDIDDTWALAMMLHSPEIDVKMILSESGNTPERAKIIARLLEVAGRTDIPVSVGKQTDEDTLRQSPWVEDYDLRYYPGTVNYNGIDALIDMIINSDEQTTLICIGPLTNIAEALRRNPEIASKVNFIGMQGSVYKGYEGNADPHIEYNVKADIEAAKQVFEAGWEITIAPLDTCGIIYLDGSHYQSIINSQNPLAKAVIENYYIWLNGSSDNGRSSILFDTEAIYLAFAEDYLGVKPVNLIITDDGFTRPDNSAKSIRCALEWKNLAAFKDLLTERITGDAYPLG